MAGRKGPTEFTHWSRPRTRMYDYNYEYASSYYRPQVKYIGETVDAQTRRSRRATVSPPGARTFQERWAANPFYGRYEPISEYQFSRKGRASSVPDLNQVPAEYEAAANYGLSSRNVRGRSMTRAASVAREQSVFQREQSVGRSVTRARSMTRARSVSRARSVFDEDNRSVRGGSVVSYYDDDGYNYDPLSDQEWERILKNASRDERERSIFQLRMSLENPRELPKKKSMQTTVGHGFYQSSLYGTYTWGSGGRQ
jgi:hypothetical protein